MPARLPNTEACRPAGRMGTIIEGYQERLAELEIEPDAAQSALAARLDALQSELMQLRRKRNVVSRILGKRARSPRGLYIWGAVGRGKTMLMDLFFEETPFEPKRRAHSHALLGVAHALAAR